METKLNNRKCGKVPTQFINEAVVKSTENKTNNLKTVIHRKIKKKIRQSCYFTGVFNFLLKVKLVCINEYIMSGSFRVGRFSQRTK